MTCTCPTTDCPVHGGLKACPFCWCRPKESHVIVDGRLDLTGYINCETPNCAMSIGCGRKTWNTRAETSPTHSDKGEVCEICDGAGILTVEDMKANKITVSTCPACYKNKCVCGETSSRNCPVHQNQPSDKLEGEPEFKTESWLLAVSKTTQTAKLACDQIRKCQAHIDRLNAALAKLRGKP